jgi:putative colanic acid biosysnthesis UDP-glucose lipid carrier transferase
MAGWRFGPETKNMNALGLGESLLGFRPSVPLVLSLKRQFDLAAIAGSLLIISFAYDQAFTGHYWALLIVAHFVTGRVFDELGLFRSWPEASFGRYRQGLIFGWCIVIAILLFLGYITKFSGEYSRRVLLTWFLVVPIMLLLLSNAFAQTRIIRALSRQDARKALIIGVNDLGLNLARAIRKDPNLSMEIYGFFDARSSDRLSIGPLDTLVGGLDGVPDFVRQEKITTVFIALPMTASPRMVQIVQELHDTTASIYFVPDLLVYDSIQPKIDNVGSIPVIAVCETPFQGADGLIKRASDVFLASVALILLWPLMITLAIGVKLSSPGSVFFRQRRYGVGGKEIRIFKFRSMTVLEDGANVLQATREDPRTTKFGAFLRRTSMDEIPQLFNVLLGEMSIVGPRPHAVAHNETYRSLIQGYMIRHKVRPGITGWAQVHGLRGETRTLDEMKARVEYDLYYLRRWSLWLDLRIMFRTIRIIFKDKMAY